MQEILKNLALIDLTRFCKQQGLNIEDSHVVKANRGYSYTLVRKAPCTKLGFQPVASVTFKRNGVPTHMVYTTA